MNLIPFFAWPELPCLIVFLPCFYLLVFADFMLPAPMYLP